jgi:predicted HTH domain antitoxin
MSIVISEDIVRASGLSEQELIIELVLLLFQQEKISLGKAAELLNISQVRFQQILSDRGINIHYDVEELQEDIQHLTAKGWL